MESYVEIQLQNQSTAIAGLSVGLLATLFGLQMSSAIESTPLYGSSIGGMACRLSKYCRWSDQQRLSIVNTAIGVPVYALSSLIVIGSCCHQQAHHLPRHL